MGDAIGNHSRASQPVGRERHQGDWRSVDDQSHIRGPLQGGVRLLARNGWPNAASECARNAEHAGCRLAIRRTCPRLGLPARPFAVRHCARDAHVIDDVSDRTA